MAEAPLTLLSEAIQMFLKHVRVHSPDKPRTAQRYTAVLDHVARILGAKMFIEAITRPDIDDYKAARSSECTAGCAAGDAMVGPRRVRNVVDGRARHVARNAVIPDRPRRSLHQVSISRD